MRTEKEVFEMLQEVEADKRLHYKSADVFINAPLALIQVELTCRANLLRKILDLPAVRYGTK